MSCQTSFFEHNSPKNVAHVCPNQSEVDAIDSHDWLQQHLTTIESHCIPCGKTFRPAIDENPFNGNE